MKIRTFVISILSLVCIFLSSISQANTLTLGLYTSDKASSIYRKFTPIAQYLTVDLSDKLQQDVKVKLKIFKSYELALEALVRGDVDFARFGPASYVHVKKQNDKISLLAMENKKGKRVFKGVIAVKKDSAIHELLDLKGKKFAFGNKLSTIGRYLAQLELMKSGIDSENLSGFSFLERHDKVFKAVEFGTFDAGALKLSTFKKLNVNNALRIIHTFDNVTKPWLAKEGMNQDMHAALKQSLLSMKKHSSLKPLKIDGFFPAEDNMYDVIRQSIKQANNF